MWFPRVIVATIKTSFKVSISHHQLNLSSGHEHPTTGWVQVAPCLQCTIHNFKKKNYSRLQNYTESPWQFSATTSGTPNEPVLFTSVFPSLPHTSFIFFHLRMSVSREPSEELESHFKTTLIASLTVYNSAQKSKSKSKAAGPATPSCRSALILQSFITEHQHVQILHQIPHLIHKDRPLLNISL